MPSFFSIRELITYLYGSMQVIVELTTLMVLNGGRRKPSNRKVAYKHAHYS